MQGACGLSTDISARVEEVKRTTNDAANDEEYYQTFQELKVNGHSDSQVVNPILLLVASTSHEIPSAHTKWDGNRLLLIVDLSGVLEVDGCYELIKRQISLVAASFSPLPGLSSFHDTLMHLLALFYLLASVKG